MNRVISRLSTAESALALVERRAIDAQKRSKFADAPMDELRKIWRGVVEKRRAKTKIHDEENLAVTTACERSLEIFSREAWHTIEPTREPQWNWHHSAICDALEAVTAGLIRDLLVNLAPRHSKSSIISILWTPWEWIVVPGQTWLTTSHSSDLAIRDCSACRRCVESSWYRKRWGAHVRLDADQNAKERYRLTAGGHRIGGSPTGVSTGDGGNRLVADDLLKISDRFSEPARRSVNQWFAEVFSSRMNDPQKGSRVVVGQRLHERDIFGELLAQGGWTHLNFIEEYEPARRCTIAMPGFTWDADPRTEQGELLWPDRFGPKQIEAIKKSNTPSGYAALYQQRPSPRGGGRFKEEWFRDFEMRDTSEGREFLLYDPSGVRIVKASTCVLFGPCDPASAEKTQGKNRPCFTVILAMASTEEKDVLIFDCYRENAAAPAVLDAMESFKARNRLDYLLAETNGLGLPILQMAVQRGIVVSGVDAAGSKESRAEAAEICARNGKVYILRNAPWRAEFLSELELFPAGEFADQVDAFSHGIRQVNFTHQVSFETGFQDFIVGTAGIIPNNLNSRLGRQGF